jgi:hypothetical protein
MPSNLYIHACKGTRVHTHTGQSCMKNEATLINGFSIVAEANCEEIIVKLFVNK